MRYLFGEFELDDELFEVRRAGTRVPLRPQALDVLLHLVANRDRVVTKRELAQKIWAGATVSETALPQAITAVRRALADEAEEPRFVQTIRSRGYRFVGELAEADAPLGGPFVGRATCMHRVLRALEDASAKRGGIVVLVGGPGSGKTRAAAELAAAARVRGARVIGAACPDLEGAPELWPWTQALRALPATPNHPAEDGRFHTFDDAVERLRTAAADRPLVVVLDDLHRADPSSLLLLKFAVVSLSSARVLFVATCRDSSLASDVVLARTVGAIARDDPTRLLRLEALAREDVAMLAAHILGRADEPLVARIHQKSQGNPLFVTQLLHLACADGAAERTTSALLSVDAMREAIALHLAELSDACARVLSHASIFGREFALGALATVVAMPLAQVLSALDEAIAADVIARRRDPERDAFAFVHVLVRDVLYTKLPLAERARLHESAGAALAADGAHEAAAHHLERAAHILGVDEADAESAAPDRCEKLLGALRRTRR